MVKMIEHHLDRVTNSAEELHSPRHFQIGLRGYQQPRLPYQFDRPTLTRKAFTNISDDNTDLCAEDLFSPQRSSGQRDSNRHNTTNNRCYQGYIPSSHRVVGERGHLGGTLTPTKYLPSTPTNFQARNFGQFSAVKDPDYLRAKTLHKDGYAIQNRLLNSLQHRMMSDKTLRSRQMRMVRKRLNYVNGGFGERKEGLGGRDLLVTSKELYGCHRGSDPSGSCLRKKHYNDSQQNTRQNHVLQKSRSLESLNSTVIIHDEATEDDDGRESNDLHLAESGRERLFDELLYELSEIRAKSRTHRGENSTDRELREDLSNMLSRRWNDSSLARCQSRVREKACTDIYLTQTSDPDEEQDQDTSSMCDIDELEIPNENSVYRNLQQQQSADQMDAPDEETSPAGRRERDEQSIPVKNQRNVSLETTAPEGSGLGLSKLDERDPSGKRLRGYPLDLFANGVRLSQHHKFFGKLKPHQNGQVDEHGNPLRGGQNCTIF